MLWLSSDGDKDSDGPSESGDNTSESTQGAPSEPAQEKGDQYSYFIYMINYSRNNVQIFFFVFDWFMRRQ